MNIKLTLPFLAVLFSSAFFNNVRGQKTAVPLDEAHWNVRSDDFKFQKYRGVPSLHLPRGQAELKDVEFQNGVIEFDIAFPQTRGFPGIKFRIQDDMNYEELYLRPHQSGNPDANQYTPVFNGLAGWQLYYGEGHASAVKYNFDYNVQGWNHVKLIIYDTRGEVYINDMETPLFQIHELKHGNKKGPIALKGGAMAVFANFSYTPSAPSLLKLKGQDLPKPDAGFITNWQISSSFEEAKLHGLTKLDNKYLKELSWNKMETEFTGMLNVARTAVRQGQKNTVLVRLSIDSDKSQVKKLDFGFSDKVLAYINGNLVYGGSNIFGSRDYRYLGTIGLFDSLYVQLKKGKNDIVFALTENFGGWGLKARFENTDGISAIQ